jgi:hypothetical protein
MTPKSQNSSPLGNRSVNIFPRKRKSTTTEEPVSKHIIWVLLETVFSVGAALRLYNEDHRQLRDRIEGASSDDSRG